MIYQCRVCFWQGEPSDDDCPNCGADWGSMKVVEVEDINDLVEAMSPKHPDDHYIRRD